MDIREAWNNKTISTVIDGKGRILGRKSLEDSLHLSFLHNKETVFHRLDGA